MYRVYSKEVISKEIFNVNLNSEDLNVVMGGNVFLDHPELNPYDYIIVEQEKPFDYPTYNKEKNLIEEMTLFERYKNGLYELGEHQVEYEGDIITLEPGQFINPQGKLQTVEKIEGTRVEWNWELNKWEDVATNLEVVQKQYSEYEGMDTPSVIREMELQDLALAEEFVNMLIELRKLIYTLSASETQSVGYATINIPTPSKALKNFKNRFNLTK